MTSADVRPFTSVVIYGAQYANGRPIVDAYARNRSGCPGMPHAARPPCHRYESASAVLLGSVRLHRLSLTQVFHLRGEDLE